jgi:hypothetical protein
MVKKKKGITKIRLMRLNLKKRNEKKKGIKFSQHNLETSERLE